VIADSEEPQPGPLAEYQHVFEDIWQARVLSCYRLTLWGAYERTGLTVVRRQHSYCNDVLVKGGDEDLDAVGIQLLFGNFNSFLLHLETLMPGTRRSFFFFGVVTGIYIAGDHTRDFPGH
jgi:hypothetical protein